MPLARHYVDPVARATQLTTWPLSEANGRGSRLSKDSRDYTYACHVQLVLLADCKPVLSEQLGSIPWAGTMPKAYPKDTSKFDEHITQTMGRAIKPRRVLQYKGSRMPPGIRAMRNGKSFNQEAYAEYLESSHWSAFKALYRANDRYPHECVVCGDPQYELHHWTYERLGAEFFTDVVPLCRGHHAQTHEVERSGVPFKEAHLTVAGMVDAPP